MAARPIISVFLMASRSDFIVPGLEHFGTEDLHRVRTLPDGMPMRLAASGDFTSNTVYRNDPFDSSEFRLLSASITVMDASCGSATRTPARYPGHPAIAPGVRDQEASHSSAGVGVLRGRPRGRTVRSRPSR